MLPKISINLILNIWNDFNTHCSRYRSTGTCCALCSPDRTQYCINCIDSNTVTLIWTEILQITDYRLQIRPITSALKHVDMQRRPLRCIVSYLSAQIDARVKTLMVSELLTWAAESLLPQSDQHVETQVAVGRLVEVLQPPHVLPVIFDILQEQTDQTINSSYILIISWSFLWFLCRFV